MTLSLNTINETFFRWLHLKYAIPHKGKTNIKLNPGNASNLLIQEHHFLKGPRILTLKKLSSKELYSILIAKFISISNFS